MQAVVHSIEANDILDWPHWSAIDPSTEHQWFTLSVGQPNESGISLFQVAVATPLGIKQRHRKGKFVGLVVDRFEPPIVELAIKEFVASCQALTWEGIVDLLRVEMYCEYADYK